MRLSTAYGISILMHVVVLSAAGYFLPSDLFPALYPVSSGSGGLTLEFVPPGLPGGESELAVQLDMPPADAPVETPSLAETAATSEPVAIDIERPERLEARAVATWELIPPTAADVSPRSIEEPAANQPVKLAASHLPDVAQYEPPTRQARMVARDAPMASVAAAPAPGAQGATGEGAGSGAARGPGAGGGGGGVDSIPQKAPYNLPPAYPTDALLAGIEGRVLLRASIDSNGRVDDLAIERSSGWPSLDDAALTAVRRWRFLPARRRGIAVAFEVVVPVRFSIRDQQLR
jgi:protein TonB